MVAIEFSVKTRGLYNKHLLVEKSAASAFVDDPILLSLNIICQNLFPTSLS